MFRFVSPQGNIWRKAAILSTAFALVAAGGGPCCGQESPPATTGSNLKAEDWQMVSTEKSELWEISQFGGEGEVAFGRESIVMEPGDPLTGVRCTAKIPREMFEIELEARRLSNFDFFCGLTFPVGDGQCSLILGGWAGSVMGLSSIDGEDASRNPTKKLMHFDNDKWYRVRVRVDKTHIRCWIDNEQVVEQLRGEHKFDIRVEMDPCTPVGVAAFQCQSEFRKFRWRELPSQDAE